MLITSCVFTSANSEFCKVTVFSHVSALNGSFSVEMELCGVDLLNQGSNLWLASETGAEQSIM